MADTFTANYKLHLPQLGKKPWKSDWDFNFTKIDQLLGGLIIDGSVCAKCADAIDGGAISAFIETTDGSLAGAGDIPAGETHEIRIDHSGDKVFDFPLDPIFTVPGDVNCILIGDRNALDATEYGGVFVVRVENHSGDTVAVADIAWLRKGLKLS
jgi:hypothetical protein